WEARPGVAEPDAAFAEGAPQIHADAPRNRCLGQRWKSGGMSAGVANSVRIRVKQPRIAGVPLEPRATPASWDGGTGEMPVWIATQNPFRIRAEVARIVGLDEARIGVIAPDA